ncbi:MAG: response regulator transcription factor [Sphingomonadaceae bacterium]|uniref:response regulator transcription factor n=1 Tax=Thermaurantiacus sp. TaxID=2820283 RepID=UPI00298EFCB6|nr:response regulator transcription factor [Thermaurantiacus sp.]MCS6986246.1 response regulator transcription factor [Sphingomonadaceae bacterium]MDW8415693.1 response regulator transcription factor [Thermaurantiacus sp.]
MVEISAERVLIVDDHPLVRDGLRTILAVAFDSCELFEAATLEEAVGVIRREGDFDLVLLDLNIPGAHGFSGLRTLRREFPTLPVVIVSAATEKGLVDGALAEGASGFIPKSLKRSQLVDAVRHVLAGEIYVPADFAEANRPDPEEADIRSRIASLTPQQRVVLGLVVEGKPNKLIARELDVTLTTVKSHMSAILAKLGVYSRTQAVVLANRVGFRPGD